MPLPPLAVGTYRFLATSIFFETFCKFICYTLLLVVEQFPYSSSHTIKEECINIMNDPQHDDDYQGGESLGSPTPTWRA